MLDPPVPLNPCLGTPPLWDPSFIKALMAEFRTVFKHRPDDGTNNRLGTGFFHQFGLFVAIRKLQPDIVIESGAHCGLGTWVLRQAAPSAQLIVLTPFKPEVYYDQKYDSLYFVDEKFQDFGAMDWDQLVPNKSKTVVFFDDHQSGVRRCAESKQYGFEHLIFDDNTIMCDNYNPFQFCFLDELSKRFDVIKGTTLRDDFGTKIISSEDKTKWDAELSESVLSVEFLPPLWDIGQVNTDFTVNKNDVKLLTAPEIVQAITDRIPSPIMTKTDGELFFGDAIFPDEELRYRYLGYVNLSPHEQEVLKN